MNTQNQYDKAKKRRLQKICFLILIIGITGVVLVTETYAWFVGITNVSVSQFSVNVSAGEGLELSLDAKTWSSSTNNVLTIDRASAYTNIATTYSSHKNRWPVTGEGLRPISSSGTVDTTNSRLKLYEKNALASTGGGFRLIASQIGNSTTEQAGYIVFDLFIRNGNENNYITTFNAADDEDVYLTAESSVTAHPNGSSNDDYGLANSVRVAFVQIGRIKAATANANGSTAQAITCASASGVTGLCSNVSTVIWEPNDTSHKTPLITYYGLACKKRTGPNAYDTTACHALTDGTAFPTYTVKDDITSAQNIDIYDGTEINYYAANTSYIQKTDTFTDTEKALTGNNRLTFFKLAANSITKVRVYVYLEGQDVDNYDLITNGQNIYVSFGFTKDRYSVAS